MYDVVIVGAGASGAMLAATLKLKNDNIKVLLLEKNDRLGKKLSITGNGRCNLGNDNLYLKYFHSNSNLNYYSKFINNNYLDYLKEFGILVKKENNLFYPYSNQAISVCKSFERYLIDKKVDIKYNYEVKNIDKKDNIFYINDSIKSKNVVIATGGVSYPKTGSDGNSYKLIKKFGHDITKLYPSLIGLKTNYKYIKDIFGVRFDCKASLFIDDKLIDSQNGQVQFGKDYLSGICIYNLSYNVKKYIEEKRKVEISLDFILDYQLDYLKKYINSFENYKIEDALSCIINNKLANVICKNLDILNIKVKDLNEEKLNLLINNLHNMKFKIIDTKDINEAQVTSGGFILDDFNLNLESKKVSNLYVIGEALDVDGICGGYNLAWAFISAIIVSKKILK